jgi:membrane-associated protein
VQGSARPGQDQRPPAGIVARMSPQHLLETFGTIGLLVIVFAESGLLLGIILPGDSLLFTAGLFASSNHHGTLKLNLAVILIGCLLAAIAGSQVGFELGRRFGPRIFNRADSRLFKRAYVERAREFFEGNGPKAIVLARFMPIVRTLAPVLAGVGKMDVRTFTLFNVIGGAFWSVGVITAGYLLGSRFKNIDKYLLPIIAVIVIISAIPPVLELRKQRRAAALRKD